MSEPSPPVSVAILAFPEATASVVYGMYDLFLSAGRDWGLVVDGKPGPALLQPRVVARQAGPIRAANGVPILAETSLDDCGLPQVVCVPEVAVPPSEPLEGRFTAEVAWLRRAHAAGATLATACSGAMLLAEAGLLDGQDATTHWAYCDTLARRYPSVKVRRAARAGAVRRRSATGDGGWRHLVARSRAVPDRAQRGRRARDARRAHQPDRLARRRPAALRALARPRQVEDAVIARCQAWIAEHYHEPAPVGAMVRLSGLAERSFKRRFRQATGMSPLEYVHMLRLEEAKQMLESTDDPVESIANEVGYEDAGFFSRLFRRSVSLTPAQYRRRFGAMRKVLQTGGAAAVARAKAGSGGIRNAGSG